MNQQEMQQQESLEQQYQQQQNFFYESISEKLKFYKEREEKYLVVLQSIVKDKNLTTEQFELMGCLSYLVGIDYTNQPYLQKNICDNVTKRFIDYSFTPEFILAFITGLTSINEENCLEAKDKLKNKFILPIVKKNYYLIK